MALMTTKEAAARLRVAVDTLQRWTQAGKVPHIRLGRQVRFDVDVLDAWVKAQAVAPKEG